MKFFALHRILSVLLVVLISLFGVACSKQKRPPLGSSIAPQNTTDNNRPISIIPLPVSMVAGEGQFVINAQTRLFVDSQYPKSLAIAQMLADRLRKTSGLILTVEAKSAEAMREPAANTIYFKQVDTLVKEAYSLSVNKSAVQITGGPEGLFYGLQSLLQLLPVEVFSSGQIDEPINWTIPTVEIKDQPRFSWRGMHLDVGRHFFDVDFIKKTIDYLAMHKMNTFHWHLTEDQGWRIEIKSRPRLTSISAFRDGTLMGHISNEPHQYDSVRYGGFYTQEEVKEVVAYAAERFVTVVPEIEMPGHALAALAAYPELSCAGGPFDVSQIWGIEENTFCPGNEQTYAFLEEVLLEVLALFPSQYIHIGGDEAPKVRWKACEKCQQRIKELGLKDEHELQSYFITRMEKFLNSHGRKMIGWDEILEGGLAPNAAVMSWRGEEGGIAAAQQGHAVVMTPTEYCYFNHYQGDPNLEPLAWGDYLPIEKVYRYNPVPKVLTEEEGKWVLGVQANLWTEYIASADLAEYMLLPRLSALAEVAWTPQLSRDEADFFERLNDHYLRLEQMGANYRRPPIQGFSKTNFFIDSYRLTLERPQQKVSIHYTLDGSDPASLSPIYDQPLILTEDTLVKVAEALPGGKMATIFQADFLKKKPLPALKLGKLQSGVHYEYYEFDHKMPNTRELTALTALSSGTTAMIAFVNDELPDQFAYIFTGFINVPVRGIYTFSALSNDGSTLFIDGQLVVDNDGPHGAIERSGRIALEPGFHAIELRYFQRGGGKALQVFLQGPQMERRELTAEDYFIK